MFNHAPVPNRRVFVIAGSLVVLAFAHYHGFVSAYRGVHKKPLRHIPPNDAPDLVQIMYLCGITAKQHDRTRKDHVFND
jgi:hypothetical protein